MTESLERLFILVDNYTVYKMSAIITAIFDLSEGHYRGDVYVKTGKPGIMYGPSISEYIGDFIEAFREPENTSSSYKVFDPTDQQIKLLNTFFTTGSCIFYRGCVGMSVHLIWKWHVNTDDLNLRTKDGRDERDSRSNRMKEEAIALLKKIKDLMTPEFIARIIDQERKQRLEYDVLIPTGKKYAREIRSEDCDILLRRFDRGSIHFPKDDILRIWKTPSDVLHVVHMGPLEEVKNLNPPDSLQGDGFPS